MLKQFHLDSKTFADPVLLVDEQGEPILSTPPSAVLGELQYTTSGEGWFAVHSQADIDGISASITGEGEVWAENNLLKWSGRKPSENHQWNAKSKKWQTLSAAKIQEKQTALLKERKAQLLQQLAEVTDSKKMRYLQGYSQAEIDSFYRQEQEARGNLPLMLLHELFEGREDLESLEQLKAKVIEKADTFAIMVGALFAHKQNVEKHLEQATTLEQLAQISKEIEQWASI